MQELNLTGIPLASLAKENEEIFIPNRQDAIQLSGSSPGRLLLQHLRDEAHRFALGYHLKVRQKNALTSALDAVPGIGPKRKRALLRKFGSVRGIKEAQVADMMTVAGITPVLAAKIKEYI
jgi:excinuclease ABC subunit C